jgi:hypothetical protein
LERSINSDVAQRIRDDPCRVRTLPDRPVTDRKETFHDIFTHHGH